MRDDAELLAHVVDDLPLGVWIARAPGGEFVFANRLFREIMGMEARPDVAAGGYAEPYGICGRDGQPYPEAKMPFSRALEARATVTVDDIVIHRSDGGRVNIRATARPIFDDDGAVAYVVIAFADITAEVAAEEAQRQAEERLRMAQRLEALGTLAAGIAHDFNNMLASIRMITSVLISGEADAGRRAELSAIVGVTESAARLTRSLRTFGRDDAPTRVPLRLDELVRGVVDIASRTFDRRIAIHRDLGDAPVRVIGDPSQLEQVVLNLLINARDALAAAGGNVTVRLRRSPVREVVLEVIDDGPGIPPEIAPRIFEPYFSTKPDRDQQGTGLGLFTSFGAIKAHGGTLQHLPVRPRGACFRITLPPATREIHADAVAPPRAAMVEPVRGEGLVLVVEDEPLVRRSMRAALEVLGYQSREAADGVEALELLAREGDAFCAVLLDLVMPRMDGRETFLRLRERAPALPVILTTGRIGSQEIRALEQLGLRRFLPKPFDIAVLSRTLAEALAS